jgi:hypothetical protein
MARFAMSVINDEYAHLPEVDRPQVSIVTDKNCDNFRTCAAQLAPMKIYDDIFITFKFAHPRHGEFEYIMDMYEGEPHLYLFSKVDGLPAVTEEDDGSIMEVVNGKWEKVAVKDSSVATFVDDYISSALEGDY